MTGSTTHGMKTSLTAAGATMPKAARDIGGGRPVATVTDPDGNVLGLLDR